MERTTRWSHHASISFGTIRQRNGLDHRTDLLQGAKVSSASIEDPVIVPASERIPNRSGTGATLIGSSPPAPATTSWPRGASPPRSGDMDLVFAAVARITTAPPRA